jgi:hypothetical protein
MNDEFRGHSPLPNAQEIAWMAVEPFAAIRRMALLALFAFAVALALAPVREPVTPVEVGMQPARHERQDMDANGGVLAQAGCAHDSAGASVAPGVTLSALRLLG